MVFDVRVADKVDKEGDVLVTDCTNMTTVPAIVVVRVDICAVDDAIRSNGTLLASLVFFSVVPTEEDPQFVSVTVLVEVSVNVLTCEVWWMDDTLFGHFVIVFVMVPSRDLLNLKLWWNCMEADCWVGTSLTVSMLSEMVWKYTPLGMRIFVVIVNPCAVKMASLSTSLVEVGVSNCSECNLSMTLVVHHTILAWLGSIAILLSEEVFVRWWWYRWQSFSWFSITVLVMVLIIGDDYENATWKRSIGNGNNANIMA
jgi:hypothetical protein